MRAVVALFASSLALAATSEAMASERGPVVVWPTLTPAGDGASALPLHRPTAADGPLFTRAQELDATLRDGAEDLGFTLDVADPGPATGHARDADMIARAAKGSWVVSARLEAAGSGEVVVRIVGVPPLGHELRVRVETVKADDVPVRGLVMLRDLMQPGVASEAAEEKREADRVNAAAAGADVNTSGLRSPGRAVLAVNGALFGGYVAYSLQRASGSDDPRVLYPLLALGTGLGVGSTLLASDEWDLSTGDAWFLAAGAWWGAASGVFIANGQNVPLTDRYAYGVGTGLGGVALGTFALTRSHMDEGDAMLAHSGGAFGMFVGGLAELAYRGTTDYTPYTGAGYGAAIGVVGAGTVATFVQVSPSRVLLVDLGVGVGALAGAAAGSPLVFDNLTESKTRGFLAATLGGTIAGGTVAWILTKDAPAAPKPAWLPPGTPTAGVIGQSQTPMGAVPAYGVGWRGTF